MVTSNARFVFLSTLCVALLHILVIWRVDYPPLVDYHSHLSRAYILYERFRVPLFQEEFNVVVEPIPNVGNDLVVTALQSVVDINTAGKIFLSLIPIVFSVGVLLVSYAYLGTLSPWCIVASFFVFSSTFLHGFVNFVLGAGLFLATIALWELWRTRWTLTRFVVLSLLVLMGYSVHLAYYSFCGFAMAAVSAVELLRRKITFTQAFSNGLPLVPPLILFLLYMGGSGEVGGVIWNTLGGKLPLFGAVVRAYSVPYDVALGVSAACLAALYVFCARSNPLSSVLLWLAGYFLVLFFLSPKVLFTSWGADARFLLPMFVFFVLALPAPQSRVSWSLWGVIVALFIVRWSWIDRTWQQVDVRARRAMIGVDKVPEGAHVYPIFTRAEDSDENKIERTLMFIGNHAIIRRHAFMPSVFAAPGAQPLRYAHPHECSGECPEDVNLDAIVAGGFTHIWIFGSILPQSPSGLYLPNRLWSDGRFSLYEIRTRTVLG